MYVMFILIGFSLLVALTFLIVFIWAVRTGQFEDHYTPSVRALFDDEDRKRTNDKTADKPDNQEQRSMD